MSQSLSLIGAPFMPTTSLTGSEPASIFRGYNAVVRGLGFSPYIENYAGSKDLGQTYDLASETLTGSISFTEGSTAVTGIGTAFMTQLRPGQMILVVGEPITVKRVISDISFTAERPVTSSAINQTGYYLLVLFELDKQRGVLRRGNAVVIERKDIILAGDGSLFIDGVDTGFDASRRPKRLERSSAGTYTEYPWGFATPPPAPEIQAVTGGWKGMLAGKYSFMASWWNHITDGFSNPTEIIKQFGAVDLEIAADGRFQIDVTSLLAVRPANATGVKLWGSLSGGGVSTVNISNFSSGAWFECAKLKFNDTASQTITAVNTAENTITIPNHGFKNGDYVVYTRTGGSTDITGLTSNTSYIAMVIDNDTLKLSANATDFKAKTVIDISGSGDGVQTIGYFNASDIAHFGYLDSETGNVASGDNNQPPECEWVTEFANELFYLSCYGQRTAANPLGTSLGNYVVPGKNSNRESAPARWRISVEDTIHGFAKGVGRLFCLTPTGLPFVTPTGRTELSRLLGVPLDLPFVSRPFWTKGAISPYNITLIQSDVFAYSGRQPVRSPSNADEKSAPFELGRLIQALTKDMPDGHVLTCSDPKNQQFVLILSAVRKNEDGYWESEIIPLDLSTNPAVWQPKIKLTATDRDMIVSGAAIIDNRLEFLAGGRVQGGDPELRTYRYDERAGSGSIDWAVAFQPTDLGQEKKAKYIRSFRATGRLSSPIVQVHGANWNSSVIDADDIENGLNSLSGSIQLPSTNGLRTRGLRRKVLIKNLALYSVRLSGTWEDTGENDVDLVDELVIDVGIHGAGQ